MNWNPQQIDYRQTKAVGNNQLALSQRSAAGGFNAGQGLSRGRGQRALNQFEDANATASGQAARQSSMDEDAYANQGMQTQAMMGRADNRLQYAGMAEQRRQGRADNQFNNMTSAWGALAGLLR
jgi:hypothetical protein